MELLTQPCVFMLAQKCGFGVHSLIHVDMYVCVNMYLVCTYIIYVYIYVCSISASRSLYPLRYRDSDVFHQWWKGAL